MALVTSKLPSSRARGSNGDRMAKLVPTGAVQNNVNKGTLWVPWGVVVSVFLGERNLLDHYGTA